MWLRMKLKTFLVFSTILLLLLIQIQSFGIQPQHKPYLNDIFSGINQKNLAITVALSLGLTLSTPLITYSAESSSATSSSLLSKSKSLGLKPPAETVVDLENIKNARIKPLYEEVTYNRAVSDRDEVKTRFDTATKALRDSKIDLSSTKSLLKKYENELAQVDRKIQNAAQKKGKDNQKEKQALSQERNTVRTSIDKGRRLINSLESFIKKTTNELDVLEYRLKDSNKMVQQRKDELSRKLKDIALVKQQTAQNLVEKEKAEQKKQLRLNLDNAQKALETARQDAIKAKALNEKLKQARNVAVGEETRLKASEGLARKRLADLNAQVVKAEANLATLLNEKSTAATRLKQLEWDIVSTTDSIRASESAILKATDQYNTAKSNLK